MTTIESLASLAYTHPQFQTTALDAIKEITALTKRCAELEQRCLELMEGQVLDLARDDLRYKDQKEKS